MEWIGDQFDIDLALVPIGDLFTMGPEDSLVAIEMIDPRVVVPIHYNTFPAIEQPAEVLEDWSAAVRDLGVEPLIMDAGDAVEL
jgi:L-ascorbate metabolism protein UlaG (beta-lactamase superfamily)